MTLDEYFAHREESRRIFDRLREEIDAIGATEVRVTRSQVAFVLLATFARAWVPDRYLGGGHAPLVLSLAFCDRDASTRWKQIVEPAPGRFMHHLELWSPDDVDDEVRAWLRRAWEASA